MRRFAAFLFLLVASSLSGQVTIQNATIQNTTISVVSSVTVPDSVRAQSVEQVPPSFASPAVPSIW